MATRFAFKMQHGTRVVAMGNSLLLCQYYTVLQEQGLQIHSIFSHLPARLADKISSIQQPDLTKENPVDKGDGCQLFQGKDGLELKLLFLGQESHE